MPHRITRRLGLGLTTVTLLALLTGCSTTQAPQGNPTYPAPTTGIAQKAAAAGLQILPDEGTVLHIHTHLNITVNGDKVTVPANIGIDTKAKKYSEIHTHDTSGIIHVEAATKKTFYLRQLFKEWGVNLGSNSVGAYTTAKDGVNIKMFTNRTPYPGGFNTLPLKNKMDVTIAITTNGKVPQASPRFKWPSNY